MSLALMGAGLALDITGPPPFVSDSFTDADGVALTSHVGEIGATWAVASGFSDPITIQGNALAAVGTANFAACQASGTPPTADYTATGVVVVRSVTAPGFVAVYARQDPAADTNYGVFLTATQLQLLKRVAGAGTTLGTYTLVGGEVLGAGQTRTIAIQVAGTTISAFLDGALKLTATDASVAAAGRVAVRCRDSSLTTGLVIDRVTATP
jgi:hypothetical protein